jgi:xanthine/uracil permease
MTAAQASSLAGGVAVMISWAYESWVERKFTKSTTAGAALGAILAVLFAIAFAGGAEVQPPPSPPPAAAAQQ